MAELDSDLHAMWRRIYAKISEEAEATIKRLFGNNVLGGKLNGSAIGGAQSIPPATLPVATTSTVGGVKVDGTTITISSATISAVQFGASGVGHKAGIVPDPGSSAGSTRFLREDATWGTPAGTGYTLPNATTAALGGVTLDQAPSAGHPIALTTPRLGAAAGVTPLGPDGTIASAYLPTIGGSVAEAGRWVRAGSNPVLSATVVADQSAVQEPCVLYDGGQFKMWYRQGATDEAICYATSPDGTTWTKYGSNPVLGQGGSGVSGNAAQPCVLKVGATYYCYYTEFLGSGDMRVATSSDGLAWTRAAAVAITKPGGITSWGNRTVWIEDLTWYMLLEGSNGTIWQIYLASSSDGLTWTLGHSGTPLTNLQVHAGGAYGGPWMPTPAKIDGLYRLWYHAATASGNLPSSIFSATSPDKVTWTIGPAAILSPLGGASYEHDQVADPHVLEVDGTSYLFYDGDNNTAVTAAIGVAIFPGTLHELVSGAPLPQADPTTTEGDLVYRASGALARLGIGTNGQVLTSSGTDPTWATPSTYTLPAATTSLRGGVRPDGSTITISGDVISATTGTAIASSPLIRTPNPNTFVSTAAANQPPDFVFLSNGDLIGVGGQ